MEQKKVLMSEKKTSAKEQTPKTKYSAAEKETASAKPDFALRRTVAVLMLVLCAVIGLWSLFCAVFMNAGTAAGLVISEVITRNVSAVCDEDGAFADLIEITNTGEETASLNGVGLTDRRGRALFRFEGGKLGPGETKLIFCSGTFPFALRKDGGENLRLLDRWGQEICSVETVGLEGNQAMMWNGTEYVVTREISPGYPNTEEGREAYVESRLREESPLAVNEAVTGNLTVTAGGEQLVELINRGTEEILLSDYYLSDDDVELFRFRLPEEKLAPGELRVFRFGTEEADASFRFGRSENINLSDARGFLASSLPADCPDDWSIQLLEDGEYGLSGTVSVGYPNDEKGIAAYRAEHPLPGVIISEVLTSNRSYLHGPNWDYFDVIELYNRTGEEVDLSGWWLSDDGSDVRKAQLSGTIAPYGYRTFLASRDEIAPPSGYATVCLGLSSSGDAVILSDGEKVTQCLQIPALARDQSFGLSSGGDYAVLSSVTIGEQNSSAARKCLMPEASVAGGVFENVDKVTVELSGEGKIHYTLDSTTPTENDPLYTGPIDLTKTSVIRARCFRDGYVSSDVFAATYVINEHHSLEVACLVSEPSGLFDYYSGIYMAGPGAAEESPHYGANYWQRWERSANIAFYPSEGEGFDLPCGIRIFGGYSRSLAQKSLAVFFRGSYGYPQLDYELFGPEGLDSYESFVIRSTGQDCYYAHMRDALTTTMFRELLGTAFTQKCRPVVLYINGEYWGVYFFREKINEHYIAGNCNVPEDSVTILMQTGWASKSYLDLLTWAQNHDMSVQENFDYLASRINIESYEDYLITEMWSGNFDIGNVRYFSTPGYMDGKWTWILYDIDWSMYFLHRNSIVELMTGNVVYSPTLIKCLLKNPDYKEHFFKKFAWMLDEVWNEENINKYLNEFYAKLQPEMQRECDRWNWSYSWWESEVDWIRTFANERHSQLYGFIKSYWGFSDAQMQEYGFKP